MKHAFLIIAHNNPFTLKTLVTLLDYKDNDLFIHIDKKTNIEVFKNIKCNYSKLIFLSNRKDVRWGDFSQIECEIELYQYAYNYGKYEYYHLLSGVDLPIKTNKYIHDFFSKNKGKEFIGINNSYTVQKDIYNKALLYHILTRYYKNYKLALIIDNAFIKMQSLFKFHRHKFYSCYQKGANWASLSEECVSYLLNKRNEIYKNFKHTKCADEIYKQTIIINSHFKENIYSLDDEYISNQREIDWQRGTPYEHKETDFNILKNSSKIFARKFSDNNKKIIMLIKEDLYGNKGKEQ